MKHSYLMLSRDVTFCVIAVIIAVLYSAAPEVKSESTEIEKQIVAVKTVDKEQRPIQGTLIHLQCVRTARARPPVFLAGVVYRDKSEVEFVTDADGIAEIKYPRYYESSWHGGPVEIEALRLEISHPEYADMVIDYKVDGSEGPVVMSPGAELVAVAMLDGVPVREFAIYEYYGELESQVREGADERLVNRIREKVYPIHFSYTHKTGQKYYSEVKVMELKDGISYRIELPLYPSLSLKGVLDPSIPRPVKNGQVQVNMINEPREDPVNASVHRVFSAAVAFDGSFFLTGLPEGYGEIAAICDGFVSRIDRAKPASFRNQHFDLQSDGQEIVVEMEPTATFTGRIVNSAGKAIEGISISLSPNFIWGSLTGGIFMGRHYSARTNAKGEFTVVNLPGYGRASYTLFSRDYRIPLSIHKDVDLSPDDRVYQEIQVVSRDQANVESEEAKVAQEQPEPENIMQNRLDSLKEKIQAGRSSDFSRFPENWTSTSVIDFIPDLTKEQKKELDAFAREIISSQPENGAAHKALGVLRYMELSDSEALAELEKAMSLLPKDPEPYYFAGMAYNRLRMTKEAIAAFETTHRLQARDPRFFGYYPVLSGLYARAGRDKDLEEMVNHFKSVMRPESFPDSIILGDMLIMMKRYQESLQIYKALAKRSPGVPTSVGDEASLLGIIAGIYEAMGDQGIAREYRDISVSPMIPLLQEHALLIGEIVPDFEETDLDGKPISLKDYRGKVVLLDFWAVWCSPCRTEMPNLKQVYEKYRDSGFEVIGISLDEDESRMLEYIKENEIEWRQIFKGKAWDNPIARKYNVHSIPSPWLIDKDGRLISLRARGDKLEPMVAEALKKQ